MGSHGHTPSRTGRSELAPGFLADKCIHELFETQVERAPHAVAVLNGARQLTYQELNERSNQVAHYLVSRGVKPDTLVGLCVERSLDLVVGLLGILKAGGTYVPIDPTYPEERIHYMLEDSGVGTLLSQSFLVERLPRKERHVLCLDSESTDYARILMPQSTKNLSKEHLQLTSRHLAYVIYTSGSTGRPKGVMVEHRAFVNLLSVCQTTFGFTTEDSIPSLASQAFDISLLEILVPITQGGRCYIIASRDVMNVDLLVEQTKQVSFLHAVPSLTSAWLQSVRRSERDVYKKLRCLLVGGEAVPPTLRRNLNEWFPEVEVIELYGPTENTVLSTFWKTSQAGQESTSVHCIGKPFANICCYVLSETGDVCAPGVPGELHVGGAGLARGYLNNAELTAQKFICDPYGAEPAARMYRTGDLVRWLPDGNLEFIGRIDDQVKIRGFRIELGEIEARLQEHPAVTACVVVAREDVPGEKQLVAYVVLAVSYMAMHYQRELRSYLEGILPAYMIPSAYVSLTEIPLTPNGKVNRKDLPDPSAKAYEHSAYVAPRTETEHVLVGIWSKLLRLEAERISVHANFFELGGHSILAMVVIDQLRKLGLQTDVASIFDAPTIEGLAKLIYRDVPASSRSASNVLEIKKGISGSLFIFHDESGSATPLMALAREIETERSIYVIQFDERKWKGQSISLEILAEDYVRIIRSIQPHGPYSLAGWSSGGMIAYEVAYQLIGANQEIGFLGLMDTLVTSRLDAPLENVNTERRPAACQTIAELDDMFNAYSPHRRPGRLHLYATSESLTRDSHLGWLPYMNKAWAIRKVDGNHESLMSAPNVSALGRLISGDLRSVDSARQSTDVNYYQPLMTLQHGKSRRPSIFVLPGAGAVASSFLPLTSALGANFTVYSFQARGIGDDLVPHGSISSAVNDYLSALRASSPEEPYQFIGHSFGGWLAFEMACQLQKGGAQISSVIILDSEFPTSKHEPHTRLGRLDSMVALIRMQEEKLEMDSGLSKDYLEELRYEDQLGALLTWMKRARLLPKGAQIDVVRSLLKVFSTQLNTGYVPQAVFDGELVLVSPEEGREPGSQEKWGSLARGFRQFQIPGNHMTMLNEDNLSRVVDIIKRSHS